jgi:AmiR/NasT family two-component response regulator
LTALTDRTSGDVAEPLTEILAAYRREVAELRDEVDKLATALVTHDVIGQAKGILMATRGVTPEVAAQLLAQAGRERAASVLDIATDVVAMGGLPRSSAAATPRPLPPRRR